MCRLIWKSNFTTMPCTQDMIDNVRKQYLRALLATMEMLQHSDDFHTQSQQTNNYKDHQNDWIADK